MEEVLININYLIREKLWGSVRVACDKVSHHNIHIHTFFASCAN
jgi:hypothetical protein